MTSRISTLAFVALAAIAAFGASPAAAAGPALADAGSARCCVRVSGSHFTPNSWAYVEVLDNGVRVKDGWFQTSPPEYTLCGPRIIGLCSLGGTFSAELDPGDQCVSNRIVWSEDWSTGTWSNSVSPGCA